MEVEGEKPSSLPSNYVTIHQLKERWLQQQLQKSSSKPETPKPKPNENAIKPTNTQNQRPNFGRVTKEHKLKEVKMDNNGSTSKTLVVDDMKNPYKNDATKHNQRPNYRPVANQPKPKVDDHGSTSKTKTLVTDDLRNPKIRPVADDDGLSTKALVVDVTDYNLNGENETGDSKFDLKKKKKRNKKLRKPKVVTDQNPTGAEPEPEVEVKVVEEKMVKDPEVEMVEEKRKEGRRYGRGNGNSRFGAEPKRKMEPEKEAEVVEEKMNKKSYPTDKNPEVEMVEEKVKEGRRYGRGNGNSRFGAEPERKMEPEKEAEVVEEKMKKKSYPTDKNPEVEMVEEKGQEGRGYGRGNGNLRLGAESEQKTEPEQEAEVVEEKMKKNNYGRGKPTDRNPNGAKLKSEMVEEAVLEKWKRGLGYGRRNGNSRAVWEQKETAPVDGNNGGGGGGSDGDGDGVVEEVVKERNVGQGRDRNGSYGREGMDRNGVYGREGMDRNGGYGRDRNRGYGRDKKRVPSGSFGEQQRQIWVKKGESVVPN